MIIQPRPGSQPIALTQAEARRLIRWYLADAATPDGQAERARAYEIARAAGVDPAEYGLTPPGPPKPWGFVGGRYQRRGT